MKRALALILALCCITGLALSDKAHGQRFCIVPCGQVPALGLNSQGVGGTALMALNRLNEAAFWQTATSSGGGGSTAEEANLLIDQYQNPITFAVGINGSALTATQANAYANVNVNSGSYTYPGGNNSYQLLWTGAGTWGFAQDITGSHSTCGTNCLSLDVTPSTKMEVDLTSTGVNSTVTFSGTTVSWTGSNFSNSTPVACQAAGATLPTQIVQNTVYYVVSGATNSFSLATTVGGSAITFSGQAGTPKCYGNWARNVILVQTAYASLAQGGELWNPTFVAYLKNNFRAYRLAQLMNVYSGSECHGTATFSGTTVTYATCSRLRAGATILFWVASGDTLPSPLVQNQPYYILSASLGTTTFQVSATPGGSPITFSGGSGTFNVITGAVLTDSDRTVTGALFWGGALSGINVNYSYGIPPIEAMVSLANEAGIDLYVNIPHLAGTDWNTSAATIMHTNLNSPHKVYLEESNEIWSQAANLTTGYGNGIGSLGSQFFPGAGVNSQVSEYYIYKATRDMAIWTSTWGADSTRLVRVLGGQAGLDSNGQFLATMWAGIDTGSTPTTATISIAAPALFTVSALPSYAVAGSPLSVTTTGALPTGLSATTWAFTGGIASGSVITYYITNDGSLTATTFHVSDTAAHALAGTNTITTSGTQSGTQTVQFLYWDKLAFNHFDRYAISAYFPAADEHLPDAWSADVDGGLAKFYTEYSAGGLLPTDNSTSHTSGGTSTAFTVTTGQTLSCPPPNQAIFLIKWNQANGSNATLDADSCTTHPPIQDRLGNAAPSNSFGANQLTAMIYTSATSAGAVGTPGWRFQDKGAFQGAGYVSQTIGYMNSACTNITNSSIGLPVMNYESGQQITDLGQGDTVQINYGALANRSSQMATLYTSFYSQYPSIPCMYESFHYADISQYGDFGYFGLLESLVEPIASSPKAVAVTNFSKNTACWWSGCGGGPPPSGCTQATNFLARTSGLTTGQKANYTNFICGIETDGVGCSNTWDAIYVLWAPDSTTSLLNLCSASFPLVSHGTITFTANQGYVGNGSTGYLDTQFSPLSSGSDFTLNSAGITVCVLNSRSTSLVGDDFGASDTALGSNFYLIRPLNSSAILWDTGNNFYPTAANANAQGLWSAYITGSSTNALYNNNSSSAFGTDTHGPSNTAYGSLFISANNVQGTAANFSTDTIGFASIGKGLNGAQSAAFAARVETFMTAVGQSGC